MPSSSAGVASRNAAASQASSEIRVRAEARQSASSPSARVVMLTLWSDHAPGQVAMTIAR